MCIRFDPRVAGARVCQDVRRSVLRQSGCMLWPQGPPVKQGEAGRGTVSLVGRLRSSPGPGVSALDPPETQLFRAPAGDLSNPVQASSAVGAAGEAVGILRGSLQTPCPGAIRLRHDAVAVIRKPARGGPFYISTAPLPQLVQNISRSRPPPRLPFTDASLHARPKSAIACSLRNADIACMILQCCSGPHCLCMTSVGLLEKDHL